ncbi:hypothetical protein B0H67DRAFT_211394 [Lasiosphaeris hirsuta]|uniref:Uncharacterized protein n=1 Tax=Lasiosphaeris hirsuta TaxID=260670 RepID=A0AA40AS98_9PEZI|nr:hypothetical protein B0H67DRAFT_211394 [Lasiosphaeris hirsuta]
MSASALNQRLIFLTSASTRRSTLRAADSSVGRGSRRHWRIGERRTRLPSATMHSRRAHAAVRPIYPPPYRSCLRESALRFPHLSRSWSLATTPKYEKTAAQETLRLVPASGKYTMRRFPDASLRGLDRSSSQASACRNPGSLWACRDHSCVVGDTALV